ncbi:probable LRR receptor-like serine/threonine-protein kinase At4g31250 [Impatiens glandulifera]|uniref:probable LRR receptor-like serine/threonine-protein kinase At4g31250 n=1 Tax=Impatiens glandulifera TaxID=253017 RepID=UPI001FB07524|nr:probable LRR receptor-like serine/threonine-protein kinase At4g31250 [Impatiens glandulifera]
MIIIILHFLILSPTIISDSNSDQINALLNFKSSLSNAAAAALTTWNKNTINLCNGNISNWKGIRCVNGALVGLKLENMNLEGKIDMDSLSKLKGLKTLSFINNNFNGSIPPVARIEGIRGVFLSYNEFSGEISDETFYGMNSLRRVYLDHNRFWGKIPNSLVELKKVVEIRVDDNQFDGKIPDFMAKEISLRFQNNRFEGSIPKSMKDMDPNFFSGNPNLCGKPLQNQCKKKPISKLLLIVILIIVAVIITIALIAAFLIFRKRRSKVAEGEVGNEENSVEVKGCNKWISRRRGLVHHDHSQETYEKGDHHGKLYFVRNETREEDVFDLGELLSASAEILGSGSFGSSYKATLFNGRTVVVKRFKQMGNCRKEEFHQYMKKLGRLSHPNLLPLIAFYYRKEEKLLISMFAENGSLASHLHGYRDRQAGLDWPTRLKIIKGVARGLFHLHKEFPNQTLPHGHLKSSNVLLNFKFEPILSDYALDPVINKDHAQQFTVAYKSPESASHGPSRKTDVWSLGILILEVLTGRFPANYLKQGRGVHADLAAWVDEVVKEEWTGEVFESGMKGTKDGEVEMLRLLKIGMCCCEWDVEKRWELGFALEKIEEVKEKDTSDHEFDSSNYGSEGDSYSSSYIYNNMTHKEDESTKVMVFNY